MKQIKRSPTLLINEKVKAMWQDGEDILHVAFGESRFPVHPYLSKALNDGMSNRSYLSSLGTDSLRTKIAEYYTKQLNIDISYDQVIVGVGSKSLLYSIIQAIDGDILLPRPSLVSYSSIATMCNRSIKRFDLNKNNGYKLNIDSLKDAYSSAKNSGVNPSMLVLNSPNNPVGNSFEKSDIRTLFIYDQFQDLGIDCPRPTGGFYIYASFKKWSDQLSKIDIISCTSLSEYLLDKYKIATLPGSAFGDNPENLCLRISSSYLDMETDESAQKILDIYNDGTDERSFINDHHPRLKLFISKMNDFLNTINK